MRVLQIVTHMNRGGLETMLMNYYRQIDRTQVQFDFLVHRSQRAAYDDEIEALGGKIYRIPALNPFSPHYLKALENFFSEHHEYRVVHAHLDCMSAIPLKAAKKAGIPICVAHCHSSSQDKDLKYPLKLWYKRKIPSVADYLFACSTVAGNWMFNGHESSLLPNAINTEDYQYNPQLAIEMRDSLDLTGIPVFGHVGRFNYPKNHDFLIDVFKVIHRVLPNAKLLLVGGGEGMTDIQAKVSRLELSDAVVFTGVRSDVAALLQAMDVFVFPSHYEGLPVTLIEAQAAGLPCLISDGVPIECKKTDLVQQIPLSDSAEKWAEAAIAALKTVRRNTRQEIIDAGFDIVSNAKHLQEFYLRVHNGEKEAVF